MNVHKKKFKKFGPDIWPARGNIHTNVLLLYRLLSEITKNQMNMMNNDRTFVKQMK